MIHVIPFHPSLLGAYPTLLRSQVGYHDFNPMTLWMATYQQAPTVCIGFFVRDFLFGRYLVMMLYEDPVGSLRQRISHSKNLSLHLCSTISLWVYTHQTPWCSPQGSHRVFLSEFPRCQVYLLRSEVLVFSSASLCRAYVCAADLYHEDGEGGWHARLGG